jgi:molybdopterin molybdotransferase
VISLEEAQAFVLSSCSALPSVELPLQTSLGHVISTPVAATEPVPSFANSSMDGYAVRSADTAGAPVTLSVIGSVMAGHPLGVAVGPGQAARIMTGAPVPDGADSVCMMEETQTSADARHVTLGRAVQAGEFIRQPGRDVRVGDVVCRAGTVLTPAHIGVLAGQGLDHVMVHPHPKVGVLSNGDELFSGAGPLPFGQIRDSNRQSLLALAHREGWDRIDLGTVRDDEAALVDHLTASGAGCDALITSGGVSVGDLDLVRVVLEKLSAGSMRWMQVAIRPAKPFAFGILADSGTPVFGLPGNPVSAMVSFELFVRPALRLMAGHTVLHRPVLTATAECDMDRAVDGKLHFLRALLSLDSRGGWHVRATDGQESHQLRSMADSNALARLPDGTGVRAGEQVDVLLIDPDRVPTRQSMADSDHNEQTPS